MEQLYKEIEQAIRDHVSQLSVPKGTTQEDVFLKWKMDCRYVFLYRSANIANVEYVGNDRKRFMLRAYPQLSMNDATLKIYPISIEPRTELPKDMAGIYNFEEV